MINPGCMFRITCCHFSRVHRLSVNLAIFTILCLACAMVTEAQTIRIPLTNWLMEAASHHHRLRLETPPAATGSIKTVAPDQTKPQIEEQDAASFAPETTNAEPESGDSDKRSEDKNRPVAIVPLIVAPEPVIAPPPGADPAQFGERDGFQWRKAYQQSLLFLGIQHGFRLATEKTTRREIMQGPFFSEWFSSVRNLRGWDDADPFIVNYIGHPMQGAVTGYIQVHNDPKGIRQEIGRDRTYWKSRLKAFTWSAVYSAQFELGPLSESSLGNIGLRPYGKAKHPQAWVDLVVTPTLGTAWLVGEDALDRWVVRRLESRTSRYPVIILIRSFLNPSRSFANVLRGKWPWYRDYR
jgi:hypothetical protein